MNPFQRIAGIVNVAHHAGHDSALQPLLRALAGPLRNALLSVAVKQRQQPLRCDFCKTAAASLQTVRVMVMRKGVGIVCRRCETALPSEIERY